MPSSLVWAIAQDRDGYLWLGTDAGLIRFDGVRFVPWNPPGEPSLPIRAARAVFASRSGDLWVGGAGGVSRLRDGRVMNYVSRDGVPERVVALFEDHEGTIWAGGFVGLSRFRNSRWEQVGNSFGLPQEASVTGFYEDRERTLWITTSLGVFFSTIGNDRFKPLLSNFRIRALSEDQFGAMWILTDQSIRKLSDPVSSIRADGAQARLGPRMLRDSQGNFWVGSLGSGVIRVSNLQGKAGSSSTMVESLTPRDGLTSAVVQSLFEDREGNVWVGTQNGLNRLSEASVVTTNVSGEPIEAVRAVTSGKDGSIWVGTSHGLFGL
jgi:ligand-binding sensor domain-containing protein